MLGKCVCVLILVKDLLFSVPLRRVSQHTCQHSLKHTQTNTPQCPAIYHRFEKGCVDINNKDGERQREGQGKSVDVWFGVTF